MKILAKLAALLLAALIVQPAHAQMSNQLESMFGAMSNTTDPQVQMGQRRGVIAGGGFSMRFRERNPSLVGFDPPRWGGGCGGIDMYGGSLSYISEEEFKQLLRSITGAAAGYAFQLAMAQLCPTCADKMAELQAKVQQINQMMMGSCEAAELVVNSAASSYTDWQATQARAGSGASDEAAARGYGRDVSAVSHLNQEDPQKLEQITVGNLTWKALKRQHVDRWFVDGNDELLQDIMSFTGTIISCAPGTLGCPGGAGEGTRRGRVESRRKEGPLTLEILVYGTGLNGRAGVFRCKDGLAAEKCLNIEPLEEVPLRGLESRIREHLVGPPDDPAAGLIRRFAAHEGSLTERDEAFIAATGQYGGMILSLARRNVYAAESFARDFAGDVAAEVVYRFVSEAITAIRVAAGSLPENGDMLTELDSLLRDATDKLERGRREIARLSEGKSHMALYFKALSDELPSAPVVVRPEFSAAN